jgi:hypothetical protein
MLADPLGILTGIVQTIPTGSLNLFSEIGVSQESQSLTLPTANLLLSTSAFLFASKFKPSVTVIDMIKPKIIIK